ncbi:MAG: ABC transporter permease subunit [Rhodospirillaceae bacterium]|nr:ABC transporter permease subunit [Rhodospirillaceae bacterium]
MAETPPSRGAATAPAARRRRRLSPAAARRLAVAVFVALILLAWYGVSLTVPPVLIPGPERVALRFAQMWTDWGYLTFAVDSFVHMVAAVTIAFVLGVGVALIGYFYAPANLAIYSRLAPFLNAFSGLGWAFLALIWFGITGSAVIFAAAAALLPLAIINAGAGLQQLNREAIEMAVSFSRHPGRRIWFVILPMMFPYLFATLRLCFGIGWQVVLVAELLNGSGGLGTVINVTRMRYATDMLFSAVFLILIIVYVTDRLIFARIQARLRKVYEL